MSMDQKRDERLIYHPIKDSVIIFCALAILGLVLFLSFYLRPSGNKCYAQIRYGSTLLWEKSKEEPYFSFPESGEKTITFKKADGVAYIGEEFSFSGESVTFTLYSDCSIQIQREDIACPDHTCSRQGRIYDTYQPIVCVPNKVQIQIITEESKKAGEWDA